MGHHTAIDSLYALYCSWVFSKLIAVSSSLFLSVVQVIKILDTTLNLELMARMVETYDISLINYNCNNLANQGTISRSAETIVELEVIIIIIVIRVF